MADAAEIPTEFGRAGRRVPVLVLSRVVDQSVLAAAALLVAARLSPSRYAPIAALLIINSAAVALSDYGLGIAALRCARGQYLGPDARRRMRQLNLGVVVGSVGLGTVVGGDAGPVIALSGAIWAVSAEAFVCKSSAISRGWGHRCAISEAVSSVVLGSIIAIGAFGRQAAVVFGCALVVKHLIDALVARHPDGVFLRDGTVPRDLGLLWTTQVLAFGMGNADNLVVAVAFGARLFSIYTIAFRCAVAAPAVIANVAARTSIADLGSATKARATQQVYLRYVTPLFRLGSAAAAVGVIGGLVLAGVLGGQWAEIAPTIVVLAIATPWRMFAGQVGALAVASGVASHLARWELYRLVGFVVATSLAAIVSYPAFVSTVTVCWIVQITVLARAAERRTEVRGLPRLEAFASLAGLCAVLAGIAFAGGVL